MASLSDTQQDALKEIFNIGIGLAANTLNELLTSHIDLDVPSISLLEKQNLSKSLPELKDVELASVHLGFSGSFSGRSSLVFPADSAVKLVAALTGEGPGDVGLDAVMAGTLEEVGNIVMNSVLGAVGNVLQAPFAFSLPNYLEGTIDDVFDLKKLPEDFTVILIQANFKIQDLQIDGKIFLLFEVASFDSLLSAIDSLYAS